MSGTKKVLPDDGKLFYTPKELAQMWGYSSQAIYSLIYRGYLPARKMGRKVIILKKDIVSYLDSLPFVRDLKTD